MKPNDLIQKTAEVENLDYEGRDRLPVDILCQSALENRVFEDETFLRSFLILYRNVAEMHENRAKLMICGNGGSFADAQHIAGELSKSFEMKRRSDFRVREELRNLPNGPLIADALEEGIPVHVLGLNSSLTSAISNDFEAPAMEYAQELFVFGREHDVFLGISTSGNARNVCNACLTAGAMGVFTIGFTGPCGGKLADISELCVRVPGKSTREIQEHQQPVYHIFCRMVEARFWKESCL